MVEKLHIPASGADAAGYSAPRARRKAPGWLRRIVEISAGFVYPGTCPACRDAVAEFGGVCSACWRETGFIAPPACFSCGTPLAAGFEAGAPEPALCDSCLHAPTAWSRGVAAVVYAGSGRRLILGLKHADRLDIAPLAAGWMLRGQGGAGARLVAEADIIAPAPLHWRRLLRRRYNQSGELAREIARRAGREEALALDLLTRTRATPSQDGRNRAARHENVAGAFAVAPRWRGGVAGKRVLLVDDVLTTGATLTGCAEVCLDAGAADVNVLVFARVARDEWPT